MLKELYMTTVVKELQSEFGYKNIYQIPKIDKVVINMGIGKAIENPKLIDDAVEILRTITGQQPVVNRAKRAISNFKLRIGQPIGVSVTLRKKRMWDFLDRLVVVALPRVRDFRGLPPNKFDGRGNYNFGIKEHIIFPEIDYDKTNVILGMDINIVTTAKTDQEAEALLRKLGFPLRERR